MNGTAAEGEVMGYWSIRDEHAAPDAVGAACCYGVKVSTILVPRAGISFVTLAFFFCGNYFSCRSMILVFRSITRGDIYSPKQSKDRKAQTPMW